MRPSRPRTNVSLSNELFTRLCRLCTRRPTIPAGGVIAFVVLTIVAVAVMPGLAADPSPVLDPPLTLRAPDLPRSVLEEFGLSAEELPGDLYLIRAPSPLPADAGVVVHARRRDLFVVSGTEAAIERLRARGLQVQTIGSGARRPASPARTWRQITEPDPRVQAMADEVAWEGLFAKIHMLEMYSTRYMYTPQHAAVAKRLRDFFADLGLDVELQTFLMPPEIDEPIPTHNVIATQLGNVWPDSIVIICGHYDSISEIPMLLAPGADDNASGVAAVMTAAEILSRHQFDYTIQYICFAAEEGMAYGSRYYVLHAMKDKLKIVGALNFDMIGYWTPGVDFDLEVEANEPSAWLGHAVLNAAELYTDMPCQLYITDIGWSDNGVFWKYGYAALNHEEAWDFDDPDFNPHFHRSTDISNFVNPDFTTGNAKVAVAALATVAGLALPPTGAVAGRVVADCPAAGTGLLGVVVDVFVTESDELASSDTTNTNGEYQIAGLPPGGYTLAIVTPIGYAASSEEINVTVAGGQTTTADFDLSCTNATSRARAAGYWTHEFAAAIRHRGNGRSDAATLCRYLDIIDAHFNHNVLNRVVVYQPPENGECRDKLLTACTLLRPKENFRMPARARRQLFALLLNVASGKLGPREIASRDGATVSQAITFCDSLLDDASLKNDAIAERIALRLNTGHRVRGGVIPLGMRDIAYAPPVGETASRPGFSLAGVYPNPFNPNTTIRFSIPETGDVNLRIYDVAGRLVRSLVSGPTPAGAHAVDWNGRDAVGHAVSAGVYFVRLESNGKAQTKKIVLLR